VGKEKWCGKLKDKNMKINRIFIHGLESSSLSTKAVLLRKIFPNEIVTPDFTGDFEARMAQLEPILAQGNNWRIVGSSFGGLMATVYAIHHPEKVHQLVLLAPALVKRAFGENLPGQVDIPTTIYQGAQDEVCPLDEVHFYAKHIFTNLTFHVVEDRHRLEKTIPTIDWKVLL